MSLVPKLLNAKKENTHHRKKETEMMEMPSAYVLFNVDSGSEDRVLKELRSINEVQEAFFSYGAYDLVVKVKADSMEELRELVSHHLRIIPGVKSTLTLIEVEEKRIIVTV